MGLFFEWSSEKKDEAIKIIYWSQGHQVLIKDGYIVIENSNLYVVVETQTGKIVETRIKENIQLKIMMVLLVIGFLEGQMILFLIIILKGFFINQSPSYEVVDIGPGFVELRDLSLGVFKKYPF